MSSLGSSPDSSPAPLSLPLPSSPVSFSLSLALSHPQVPLAWGEASGVGQSQGPQPPPSLGPRGVGDAEREGAGVMENPCGSQGQCLQTQPGLEPGLPPGPAPSGLSQRPALCRDLRGTPELLWVPATGTSEWSVLEYGDGAVQLAHFIDR